MGRLPRAAQEVHRERPEKCARLERSLADRPSLTSRRTVTGRGNISVDVSVGGAIDIGSNSVHLLVAITGQGFIYPLRDTSELLGLGDVVDGRGSIPKAKRLAVVNVLKQYVATSRRSRADRVTLIGTDPLRRAQNVAVLSDEIWDATNLRLRVLTVHEEAILTFIGTTRGEAPDHTLLVVDIGGGSTEISTWNPERGLEVASIPLGSGRLTNALIEHDPPTTSELESLSRAAADALAPVDGTGRPIVRAVFVGGTATNVGRLGRLSRDALAEDLLTLGRLTFAQVSTRFGVRPRRARQLAAGVLIVDAILAKFGLDSADVSDASLRDGAIIAAAAFGDEWPERMEELLGDGVS